MNWLQEPQVEGELSTSAVRFHKILWEARIAPGARRVVPKLWPTSLCFFDQNKYPGVTGYVALTFDDAFCRPGHESNAMIHEVCTIMKKHHATGTFFTIGDSCSPVLDDAIKTLLDDGSELSNHCGTDRKHDSDTIEEFTNSLDKADKELVRLQSHVNQWFRAPHGQLSNTMDDVLATRGMQNVMFDCYGNDTQIPDGKYIANVMLRLIDHGSISLIHMPERNFREWNFTALKLFLEGLDKKGLKAVTLTQLAKLAGYPIIPAGPRD